MEIKFEVVPAYDLVLSLAAAARPETHELSASWARGIRQLLPQALRRELTYFFSDPASLGLGAVQLVPVLGVGDAAAFISQLDTLDPAELTVALLCRQSDSRSLRSAARRLARGKTASEDEQRLVRQHAAAFRARTRERFWEILGNPAGSKRRYISLLHAHFENWFSAQYPDTLPFLVQRAKQGRRSIGKLPTKEVIARATGGFTLQSPAARSVTLVPSYYAAPFVIVAREGREVVLVYGARPQQPEATRSALGVDTVRVLKALADETRLRILQLLRERPLYGQQLAEQLGVSHPTVSHHMAQLRIAGLTRTELTDDGNKAYSVQPETVDSLCDKLRAAFVAYRQDEGINRAPDAAERAMHK